VAARIYRLRSSIWLQRGYRQRLYDETSEHRRRTGFTRKRNRRSAAYGGTGVADVYARAPPSRVLSYGFVTVYHGTQADRVAAILSGGFADHRYNVVGSATRAAGEVDGVFVASSPAEGSR
jgi:hypothetical protein